MNTNIVRSVVVALAAAVSGQAAEYFVAPGGDDANPGTKEKPFASPARARDALRAAKQKGDRGPFAVELRGGLYTLAETLVFTPEDSGTAAAPVVWRSAPGERAVFSGGRVLGGFRETTAHGLRRWTVELPEVKAGGKTFRQLFVATDGQTFERRYRPQLGMKRVDGVTDSPKRKGAAPHRAAQKDFYFAPGDFQPWENLSDVEVVVLHVWSSSRLCVAKVDAANSKVTFTGLPTFAVSQGGLQPYFIENVKEALQTPGEWYLDRPAGVLTYLPREGETLANTTVVAPRLVNVLALTGAFQQGARVEHLTFENLGFMFNEAPLPREGYGGSQGQADLPAAIELTGAKCCTFRRCTVSQTGSYGIGIGLGSHENKLVGCRLFDLGGGGVKVGDMRMKADAPAAEVPTGNRIENCAIFDGGLLYFSANAIWGGLVRGTELRHNQIWNFPYSGIAMGWAWNDKPTVCGGNRIVDNCISNVLTLIADGASIYTLGRQPGTVIRGNVVRDNVKSPFAKEHWQLGLYLDEGSSEMLVENNFVYRVGTHGFNMNGGAQCVIRNNILGPVYGHHAPYIRCQRKTYARENVFTRNLAWCDSTNLVNAVWDQALCASSSNLYWNCAGRAFKFFDKTFAEWQARGQDAGSLVTDPLFEAPERGDFRLKAASPAFALGFVPFDLAAAGLEPAFKDVAVPAKTMPPPFYAMQLPAGPRAFTGCAPDLNGVAVGSLPRGFACAGGTPEAHFRVAAGVGKNGGRALVATDRKGAAKPFYPYLTYKLPAPLEHGTLTFSCDVQQKSGAPVTLAIGFRDYSKRGNPKKDFVSSPEVLFSADGKIRAGTTVVTAAAPGSWTHVELSFPLEGAAREARIVLTLADGTRKETKTPVSAEFSTVSTLGFFCGEAMDGVCYLDNVRLLVTK
jgi:hypothetical protein